MTYAKPISHFSRVRMVVRGMMRRSVWGRHTAGLNAFEIGEKREGKKAESLEQLED